MWSGWRTGKESEKKEWCPPGKMDMASRTSVCFVEGHVELHMSLQSLPLVHIAWKIREVQAIEARVWASIRVKTWVSMIFGWMAVIVVPFPAPWPCLED